MNLNRIAVFLLVILAACILTACGGGETEEQFEGTTAEQKAAFETNLALWEATGTENYDFTYQATVPCDDCEEQLGYPARVSVRAGEVTAAESADENEISNEDMVNRVQTVDAIFANIGALIADETGKYSLEVSYDETLGYPTESNVTCLDEDPNCISGVSVVNFEEVTAP